MYGSGVIGAVIFLSSQGELKNSCAEILLLMSRHGLALKKSGVLEALCMVGRVVYPKNVHERAIKPVRRNFVVPARIGNRSLFCNQVDASKRELSVAS